MRFLSVGINHTTAPLEVREKLAFSPQQTLSFLSSPPEKVVEAFLLSTCNRTEVYAAVDGEGGGQKLINWLASFKGLSTEGISPYFYFYQDKEAIRHLFQVTSGLDSLAFGEEQIQGQVRRAMELSIKAGASRRLLSFLLREALRVGRCLHRETELRNMRVSVGDLALEIARKRLGGLENFCLLIISAGSTAHLIGKLARLNKISKILVTNRTFSRAEDLAKKLGGKAIPFELLPQSLIQVDVVASATSSPNPVITAELIRDVMPSRNHRPLLLLDLAVPRDIDPSVRDIGGVWLYDIDDLQHEIKGGDENRTRIIKQAEVIIEEEVRRVLNWWRLQQEAVPVIKALREKAEQIRLRELRKTLKKLNLPEEEKSQLDILTRSLLNKLLHLPTIKLKEKPERASIIKEIFDLNI